MLCMPHQWLKASFPITYAWKVTVTQKWFVILRHPKMHLHTKFGIPISKNIGDMHQFLETRSGQVQGHSDLIMVCDTLSSQDRSTRHI